MMKPRLSFSFEKDVTNIQGLIREFKSAPPDLYVNLNQFMAVLHKIAEGIPVWKGVSVIDGFMFEKGSASQKKPARRSRTRRSRK